jgi:hypothetical protein
VACHQAQELADNKEKKAEANAAAEGAGTTRKGQVTGLSARGDVEEVVSEITRTVVVKKSNGDEPMFKVRA